MADVPLKKTYFSVRISEALLTEMQALAEKVGCEKATKLGAELLELAVQILRSETPEIPQEMRFLRQKMRGLSEPERDGDIRLIVREIVEEMQAEKKNKGKQK